MAYTATWDETSPTGGEAANTIDDIFRATKRDIRERFADIFDIPSFAADPLRPINVKFGGASANKLVPSSANGIVVRNAADAANIITFADASVSINIHFLFTTDNTHDIGASGATRPRDLFLGRNATIGGTLGLTGNLTINTNKFTVTAASGNTVVAGTLDVTSAISSSSSINAAAASGFKLGGVVALITVSGHHVLTDPSGNNRIHAHANYTQLSAATHYWTNAAASVTYASINASLELAPGSATSSIGTTTTPWGNGIFGSSSSSYAHIYSQPALSGSIAAGTSRVTSGSATILSLSGASASGNTAGGVSIDYYKNGDNWKTALLIMNSAIATFGTMYLMPDGGTIAMGGVLVLTNQVTAGAAGAVATYLTITVNGTGYKIALNAV